MSGENAGLRAQFTQDILAKWKACILQYDIWPQFVHQHLVNATATILPTANRLERAEFRTLAAEALHHAVDPNSKRKSVCARMDTIRDWLRADPKPTPDALTSKFREAAKYASAY